MNGETCGQRERERERERVRAKERPKERAKERERGEQQVPSQGEIWNEANMWEWFKLQVICEGEKQTNVHSSKV